MVMSPLDFLAQSLQLQTWCNFITEKQNLLTTA